jgi:hypothetical protein
MKHDGKLQSTHEEMVKKASYHPVFNQDGVIEGISALKVETDHTLGLRAMQELLDTAEVHDDVVLPDGFTMRQKRILHAPAPDAAHYLKHSSKWDATTGEQFDSVTINIPTDVVWSLFEGLFDGQYSLRIAETSCESEDVLPVGEDHKGEAPDNAPGRIFFAKARVVLTIHLKDGASREYEGLGVAYGEIRMKKMGNVFAINSAHRTAEKGAVSDAKREALANVGRVFRRAFEDGDDMIARFEQLLLEILQKRNGKPGLPSASGSASPAPRRARNKAPVEKAPESPPVAKSEPAPAATTEPGGYTPFDAHIEAEGIGSQVADASTEGVKEGDRASAQEESSGDLDNSGIDDAVDGPEVAQKTDVEPTEVEAEASSPPARTSGKAKPDRKPQKARRISVIGHDGKATVCTGDDEVSSLLMGMITDSDKPNAAVALIEANRGAIDKTRDPEGLRTTLLRVAKAGLDEDGIPDFDAVETIAPIEERSSEPAVEVAAKSAGSGEEAEPATEAPKQNWVIDPRGRSSKRVLAAYKELFAKAKSQSDLERILEDNALAARKLKGADIMEMAQAKMDRAAEL